MRLKFGHLDRGRSSFLLLMIVAFVLVLLDTGQARTISMISPEKKADIPCILRNCDCSLPSLRDICKDTFSTANQPFIPVVPVLIRCNCGSFDLNNFGKPQAEDIVGQQIDCQQYGYHQIDLFHYCYLLYDLNKPATPQNALEDRFTVPKPKAHIDIFDEHGEVHKAGVSPSINDAEPTSRNTEIQMPILNTTGTQHAIRENRTVEMEDGLNGEYGAVSVAGNSVDYITNVSLDLKALKTLPSRMKRATQTRQLGKIRVGKAGKGMEDKKFGKGKKAREGKIGKKSGKGKKGEKGKRRKKFGKDKKGKKPGGPKQTELGNKIRKIKPPRLDKDILSAGNDKLYEETYDTCQCVCSKSKTSRKPVPSGKSADVNDKSLAQVHSDTNVNYDENDNIKDLPSTGKYRDNLVNGEDSREVRPFNDYLSSRSKRRADGKRRISMEKRNTVDTVEYLENSDEHLHDVRKRDKIHKRTNDVYEEKRDPDTGQLDGKFATDSDKDRRQRTSKATYKDENSKEDDQQNNKGYESDDDHKHRKRRIIRPKGTKQRNSRKLISSNRKKQTLYETESDRNAELDQDTKKYVVKLEGDTEEKARNRNGGEKESYDDDLKPKEHDQVGEDSDDEDLDWDEDDYSYEDDERSIEVDPEEEEDLEHDYIVEVSETAETDVDNQDENDDEVQEKGKDLDEYDDCSHDLISEETTADKTDYDTTKADEDGDHAYHDFDEDFAGNSVDYSTNVSLDLKALKTLPSRMKRATQMRHLGKIRVGKAGKGMKGKRSGKGKKAKEGKIGQKSGKDEKGKRRKKSGKDKKGKKPGGPKQTKLGNKIRKIKPPKLDKDILSAGNDKLYEETYDACHCVCSKSKTSRKPVPSGKSGDVNDKGLAQVHSDTNVNYDENDNIKALPSTGKYRDNLINGEDSREVRHLPSNDYISSRSKRRADGKRRISKEKGNTVEYLDISDEPLHDVTKRDKMHKRTNDVHEKKRNPDTGQLDGKFATDSDNDRKQGTSKATYKDENSIDDDKQNTKGYESDDDHKHRKRRIIRPKGTKQRNSRKFISSNRKKQALYETESDKNAELDQDTKKYVVKLEGDNEKKTSIRNGGEKGSDDDDLKPKEHDQVGEDSDDEDLDWDEDDYSYEDDERSIEIDPEEEEDLDNDYIVEESETAETDVDNQDENDDEVQEKGKDLDEYDASTYDFISEETTADKTNYDTTKADEDGDHAYHDFDEDVEDEDAEATRGNDDAKENKDESYDEYTNDDEDDERDKDGSDSDETDGRDQDNKKDENDRITERIDFEENEDGFYNLDEFEAEKDHDAENETDGTFGTALSTDDRLKDKVKSRNYRNRNHLGDTSEDHKRPQQSSDGAGLDERIKRDKGPEAHATNQIKDTDESIKTWKSTLRNTARPGTDTKKYANTHEASSAKPGKDTKEQAASLGISIAELSISTKGHVGKHDSSVAALGKIAGLDKDREKHGVKHGYDSTKNAKKSRDSVHNAAKVGKEAIKNATKHIQAAKPRKDTENHAADDDEKTEHSQVTKPDTATVGEETVRRGAKHRKNKEKHGRRHSTYNKDTKKATKKHTSKHGISAAKHRKNKEKHGRKHSTYTEKKHAEKLVAEHGKAREKSTDHGRDITPNSKDTETFASEQSVSATHVGKDTKTHTSKHGVSAAKRRKDKEKHSKDAENGREAEKRASSNRDLLVSRPSEKDEKRHRSTRVKDTKIPSKVSDTGKEAEKHASKHSISAARHDREKHGGKHDKNIKKNNKYNSKKAEVGKTSEKHTKPAKDSEKHTAKHVDSVKIGAEHVQDPESNDAKISKERKKRVNKHGVPFRTLGKDSEKHVVKHGRGIAKRDKHGQETGQTDTKLEDTEKHTTKQNITVKRVAKDTNKHAPTHGLPAARPRIDKENHGSKHIDKKKTVKQNVDNVAEVDKKSAKRATQHRISAAEHDTGTAKPANTQSKDITKDGGTGHGQQDTEQNGSGIGNHTEKQTTKHISAAKPNTGTLKHATKQDTSAAKHKTDTANHPAQNDKNAEHDQDTEQTNEKPDTNTKKHGTSAAKPNVDTAKHAKKHRGTAAKHNTGTVKHDAKIDKDIEHDQDTEQKNEKPGEDSEEQATKNHISAATTIDTAKHAKHHDSGSKQNVEPAKNASQNDPDTEQNNAKPDSDTRKYASKRGLFAAIHGTKTEQHGAVAAAKFVKGSRHGQDTEQNDVEDEEESPTEKKVTHYGKDNEKDQVHDNESKPKSNEQNQDDAAIGAEYEWEGSDYSFDENQNAEQTDADGENTLDEGHYKSENMEREDNDNNVEQETDHSEKSDTTESPDSVIKVETETVKSRNYRNRNSLGNIPEDPKDINVQEQDHNVDGEKTQKQQLDVVTHDDNLELNEDGYRNEIEVNEGDKQYDDDEESYDYPNLSDEKHDHGEHSYDVEETDDKIEFVIKDENTKTYNDEDSGQSYDEDNEAYITEDKESAGDVETDANQEDDNDDDTQQQDDDEDESERQAKSKPNKDVEVGNTYENDDIDDTDDSGGDAMEMTQDNEDVVSYNDDDGGDSKQENETDTETETKRSVGVRNVYDDGDIEDNDDSRGKTMEINMEEEDELSYDDDTQQQDDADEYDKETKTYNDVEVDSANDDDEAIYYDEYGAGGEKTETNQDDDNVSSYDDDETQYQSEADERDQETKTIKDMEVDIDTYDDEEMEEADERDGEMDDDDMLSYDDYPQHQEDADENYKETKRNKDVEADREEDLKALIMELDRHQSQDKNKKYKRHRRKYRKSQLSVGKQHSHDNSGDGVDDKVDNSHLESNNKGRHKRVKRKHKRSYKISSDDAESELGHSHQKGMGDQNKFQTHQRFHDAQALREGKPELKSRNIDYEQSSDSIISELGSINGEADSEIESGFMTANYEQSIDYTATGEPTLTPIDYMYYMYDKYMRRK